MKKKALVSGRNWRKRFFSLDTNAEKCSSVSYFDSYESYYFKRSSPKRSLKLTQRTSIVSNVADSIYANNFPKDSVSLGITIVGDDHPPLHLITPDKIAHDRWVDAFQVAVGAKGKDESAKQDGVFLEGQLYKTPTNPKKWEKRRFELADGHLVYTSASGKNVKGKIRLHSCQLLSGLTHAKGAPTPHVFQVIVPERTYNLCASSQAQLKEWEQAIRTWRKRSSAARPESPRQPIVSH